METACCRGLTRFTPIRVGFDAVVSGQVLVPQELRAAVEGDGLACRGGQRPQGFADGAQDIARAPVGVGDEADKAALALDQGGYVGLAVGAAEDQQVGLPVPDGMALTDLGRALGDGPLERDLEAARLAAEASAPQPPGAEQVAVQLERPAFRAVDELVDGLVADTRLIANALQPAGDLLG